MARPATISIYTVLKDAGFKKAEKGLKGLNSQANGLNSTLAKLGLSVGVAQFARSSIQAALDMEKANVRLDQSLVNIGKSSAGASTQLKESEKQMMALGFEQTQTAYALSTLVTATGSLEKSQGLLASSADLARYKQIELADAATILARAQGGNAKAFKELGITLDKSKPKTQALADAMALLNAKIGGQAQRYVETYGGKIEVLKAKFQDTQEQVGMKLLPVLAKLGDWLINTGIPRTESFFKLMADHKESVIGMAAALTSVALAFKLIGTYAALAKVAALPILSAAAPFIAGAAALIGAIGATESASAASKARTTAARGAGLSKFGVGARPYLGSPGGTVGFQGSPIPGMTKGKTTTGIDKQALETNKQMLASQKASLALAKKEAAAKALEARKAAAEKKLAAQFDLTQIALANALKLNLTEKERAAVEGLIALQDDGYKTEAQRMKDQETALNKLISLKQTYAETPWNKTTTLAGQEKQVVVPGSPATESVAGGVGDVATKAIIAQQTAAPAPAPSLGNQPALVPTTMMSTGMGATARGEYANAPAPVVNVTVNGSVTTEQQLLNTIYEGLGNKLRAGATWYTNAATG